MVRSSAARRGCGVLGGLPALCFSWALVAFCGLPALAQAESPACPGPPLEVPAEMPQPEREIRGLRNDVREACLAEAGRASEVVEKSAAVQAGVELLHEDLSPLGGTLPVTVAGQAGPLEVVEGEGDGGGGSQTVAVSNLQGVEDAVVQNSETVNAALWGIAGLFCGFFLLGVVFKLVRP